jgi:hypothetical protein
MPFSIRPYRCFPVAMRCHTTRPRFSMLPYVSVLLTGRRVSSPVKETLLLENFWLQ